MTVPPIVVYTNFAYLRVHSFGGRSFANILTKRARVEGFIVLDYMHRAQEAIRDLSQWYAQGRLRYRVDVVEGLENAPRAINKLFDGSNHGKLIVKVSTE